MARKWVIIGEVYYIIRAGIIIYPLWNNNTIFEKTMIAVQTVLALSIAGIIIYSYKFTIKPVMYTLYMQAILFLISNFNVYRKENFNNS